MKEIRLAKSRLGLPSDERSAVARRLAVATMRAVTSTSAVGRTYVVTSDAWVAGRARACGATVVDEVTCGDLDRAVDLGRDRACAEGPEDSVAVLVADLPLLCPEDVEAVLAELDRRGHPLLVPDRQGTGTTMLLHGPEDRLPVAFGPGSAHRHERLGYRPVRTVVPRLRADLDLPTDLELLAPVVAGTQTFRRY